MESFPTLFSGQTNWLADQARAHIVAQGYRRQVALLPESFHQAVFSMSTALCRALELPDSPDEKARAMALIAEPAAWFTGTAQQLRRSSAVPMAVCFGLIKGLRRGYLELLLGAGLPSDARERAHRVLENVFDWMEQSYCDAWSEGEAGRAARQSEPAPPEKPGGTSGTSGFDRACDLAVANEQLRSEIRIRLRVEEELKLVKEFLTALLDYAPVPIVATDRRHAYLLVNRAWEAATGLTRDEVIGRTSREIFPPEVASLINTCNMEVIDDRRAKTFQELVHTPQGEHLYHTVKFPLLDDLGEVETVGAISIDITEKTCAEEKLRESEERYRNVVELSTNAIFIVIDGRYAFANRAGVRLLGASDPEEIVDREVLDFIHPESRDAEQQRIRMLQEEGVAPFAKEEKYIRLDGAVVDVDVASIPFTFQDRSAILILAQDITERKKLEQELEKNERFESLGLLAGGIAHDFNNLLSAILGNISLSKLLTPEDVETHHLLAEAENASLRARDLTRQLLTFARGGAPVKKSATVGELIRETCAFALRGSNVGCIYDIPADLPRVEVDVGQISQVVQNLVMNAGQAMPEGGTITVICEVAAGEELPPQLTGGRYVRISIVDTGHGIHPDHLKRIFDPYFTTKQKGSGLGLATAYSIVKKHDGCIMAQSELGRGSQFSIYLPASDAPAGAQQGAHPAPFIGKGRVLFMDDEEAVRFLAGHTLRRMGFEVAFAKDGVQAIALYSEARAAGDPFCAVVMDLTIPGGMGGKEAVRRLKELDPELKAFVSSGYSDDPVMAHPERYGFCGVIPKPFLYEEMAAALQQVFGSL